MSNDENTLMDTFISRNSSEEADQIRHMILSRVALMNALLMNTGDLQKTLNVRYLLCLSTTSGSTYYDINKISVEPGERKCRALPFFHAFTGCDIVSSFYNHSKCKFWDRCFESEEEELLTDVFMTLSDKPEYVDDEQLSIIQQYVGFVYYGKEVPSIDIERMNEFDSLHGNLNHLHVRV